jgi:hypothetical protein
MSRGPAADVVAEGCCFSRTVLGYQAEELLARVESSVWAGVTHLQLMGTIAANSYRHTLTSSIGHFLLA